MLRIDTRAGSQELIAPLQVLGLPVEEAMLASGDIEILGNGPDGPLLIGVEHKKIPDLIGSIRSGRLADQLRTMRESYAVSWLLVQGRMREWGSKLQVQRECGKWFDQPGGVTYAEIASYTLTAALRGGALLWRTETQAESVAWVKALYRWCTAKEWSEHRSHLEWYRPDDDGANPFTGPTLVQQMARPLPRVGMVKSARVAERFHSPREMVNATPEQWAEIRGIGQVEAAAIDQALDGRF